MFKTILPLGALTLAVSACGGGSTGALGQTQVRAECDPGDVVCLQTSVAPLARGATLALDISSLIQGSAAVDLSLLAADEAVARVDGDAVIGGDPGVTAVLFLTPDGVVLDFIHLTVAEPTALVVRRLTDDGESVAELEGRVQLLVGETFGVSASLRHQGQDLAGKVAIRWQTDPAIAPILDSGSLGRKRILARAPGRTVLQARAGGLITEIPVEVLP